VQYIHLQSYPNMKLQTAILCLTSIVSAQAFAPSAAHSKVVTRLNAESHLSRQDFLSAAVVSTAASVIFSTAEPAQARGRATLEFAIDRYYPRLEAGGSFYTNDLKKAIEKNDWAAIKVRTWYSSFLISILA